MRTLRKLNFFLVTVCLIVFALTTTITGAIYRKVLFENTYETTLGFLKQMEFNFSEKRNKFQETAVSLLAGESLKRLDDEGSLESAYAYEAINGFNKDVLSVLNYSDDIASILYLNRDGILVGTDGKTVWREPAGKELFLKLEQIHKGAVFQGGFSSELFYQNKSYLGKKKEKYLSIIASYWGERENGSTGKLIINVKEKAFRNVFSSMIEKNDGEIYILDIKGKVLSSTSDGEIGTIYAGADRIERQDMPLYVIEGKKFIIYYAMPEMGWNIVWEKEIDAFYAQANLLHHILIGFVAS